MKRIFGILLILLLLFCGCAREAEQETHPTQVETVFQGEAIAETSNPPETTPTTMQPTTA